MAEPTQPPTPSQEPEPSQAPSTSTPTDPPTSQQQPQHPVEPKPDPEGPSADNTAPTADLDASVDQHIEMNPTQAENNTQPTETGPEVGNEDEDMVAPENPIQEASVDALTAAAAGAPSKKETSLREFLGRMDEYAPIIPDAVTSHYLTLAGLPPPGHGPNQTPPHLARLLALATQKFVADIAADSYQYARIRASNSTSSNPMGSLNAASGLNMPAGASGAGAAPAAGGEGGGGGGAKGKANVHLGIQRPGFGGGGSGGSGQGRTVLTMEDLGMAVGEYGVSVKRGEFYR